MLAFLFFCIAIPTAVYGGQFGNWEDDIRNFNDLSSNAADLNEDMGAVSVSISIQIDCVYVRFTNFFDT